MEAANATPYGWKVANHLGSEQGIFSEQDKTHTKALREAEGFVRRDNREFNARRKDIKKRGGTRFNHSKRGCFTPEPNNRVNNWALKHIGFLAQQVAAKYSRTGTLLTCFKCGGSKILHKKSQVISSRNEGMTVIFLNFDFILKRENLCHGFIFV